jgi:endonuclease-8
MSEGPQVKLRTEWLAKHLVDRKVVSCLTSRSELEPYIPRLAGSHVEECFCKGKHIFIRFQGGLYIHNHLLMRGRWRRIDGQLLFLPSGAWLGLYVGPHTICNYNGQMLRFVYEDSVQETLSSLGPDTMQEPYPEEEVRAALRASDLHIAEALLDQSVVCGVGNVAKSEALYLAGVDPRAFPGRLEAVRLRRLVEAIQSVMRESYRNGGRWTHRVYRRSGQRCTSCGGRVRVVRLPPSKRSTYFCPSCQS